MLLRRLDQAWGVFRESYAGLSEAELLTPGVIGLWSIKDIIAHVTTWEEEALKHLPFILQGGKPPKYSVQYGGIDAFNAQTSERKGSLSLTEVRCLQESVHQQLICLIEGVSEEHLGSGSKFAHRLRLDTYGHYRRHTAAIQRWRNRIANDELRKAD